MILSNLDNSPHDFNISMCPIVNIIKNINSSSGLPRQIFITTDDTLAMIVLISDIYIDRNLLVL